MDRTPVSGWVVVVRRNSARLVFPLDLPPGGASPPVVGMARAEKKRAARTATATAAVERPSGTSDRRPLYFAALLVLADAALVALIIAFVPCL